MTRQVKKMTEKQLMASLCASYKELLADNDIVKDIVSFSGVMEYRCTTELNKDELLIMEGRKQMALHILRHLDLEPRELIEQHNDAAIINDTLED